MADTSIRPMTQAEQDAYAAGAAAGERGKKDSMLGHLSCAEREAYERGFSNSAREVAHG